MTEPTSDETRIWSSQLRIAAGRAVEDAPQVGFVEKVDQVGRVVRLSILAEAATEGGDAFMDQFVRRIGELFDPAARSLTGALKFAVETTHEELRNWNRQHLPQEHAMYGLSCLIQRGDQEALLGQAGPSVALLAGDAGLADLRRLGLYSHPAASYLQDNDPVAAPIGGSAPVSLEFAASPALSGWALLFTSNASMLLDAELRVTLSRLPVEQTLRYLHQAMLHLRDAAVLAVGVTSTPPAQPVDDQPDDVEQPDAAAAESQIDGESAEPGAVAEGDADEDAQRPPPADHFAQEPTPTSATDPSRTSSHPSTADPTQPAPATTAPATTAPAATALATNAPMPQRADEPREIAFQPVDVRFASASLGELEAVGWPVNPFAMAGVEQVGSSMPRVALPSPRLGRPIIELGRALPSLVERRKEQKRNRPQIRTGDARGATARRVGLVLTGMAVVLLGVAAALLGPSLLQSEDDQFQASLELARNGLAASELAASTEASRLALQDALADVEVALELNPLAADALQLREQIEAVMAEYHLVQSPGELTQLADLSAFGPSIALGSIRFGDGRAFVLDDAGGRVFAVSAAGAAQVVFLEGELLGLGSQLRAGRPISIAWQPRQPNATDGLPASDGLWILDSHARLYRWTPSGVLLVPIPELVRLGSVDAVAATAGSVFLLDQSGGAVWRFPIEQTELGPPARSVGRTDLHNATELLATVNEEGAVDFLVASGDGRLRRFRGDEELPLAIELERPLLGPASISIGEQSGLIYAVDRGQGRVIAVGAEGGVVSQIQSQELSELRGAWIDESSGQITYALPDSLVIGRLPSWQE